MQSKLNKNKPVFLFISKDNLTTTPRIKKEILTAKKQNFDATFLGFELNNWSDRAEEKFRNENPEINYIYLPASRKSKSLLWLLSVIVEKISRLLWPLFPKSVSLAAFAHSRRSFALWLHLLFHGKKYNFVSAHTLPAIYPAYKLAKRKGIKWSFDLEDYHPGETIGTDTKNERQRRELLLANLLPQTDFFTYASPLFLEQITKLTGATKLPENFYIANSFPGDFFSLEINASDKISFVWFSQNIAPGRGLELLLPALWQHRQKIHLTLIGNLYDDFYKEFLARYKEILTIKKPMEEKELYAEICKHDIGCAIEISSIDINKDMALSNKIYAYAQAGLFILATDTQGQKWFIEKYPYFGILAQQSTEGLDNKISFILRKAGLIRSTKNLRFAKAKELSWENEEIKLVDKWQKLISG